MKNCSTTSMRPIPQTCRGVAGGATEEGLTSGVIAVGSVWRIVAAANTDVHAPVMRRIAPAST